MKSIFTFIIIIILCFNSFGQTWITSNQLKSDDDLRIYDIKKDNNENFYVAGIFKGTFNGNTTEGNYDIFIAKLNISFNIEWVKTAGSSSMEFDPRIAIDNDNNIFLTGAFKDSCVFDNKYLKSDGGYDVFLAKYTTTGALNWTKKIASYPSQQNPTDIDVTPNNDLILTGHYTDSVFIYDEKIVSSGKNNFYAKFDTSGTKIWVKNVSGSSISSRFANVKVYQNEYYFNGYFRDNMNFDIGTLTSNVAGKQDIFIYKTDNDGNGLWVRRTYGDEFDVTGSITGDNYGNIYFTGYFKSSTLSTDSTETLLANQVLTHVNDFDIFILKYNKTGTLQWNKQFGKNGREYGIDLNVNRDILYMSGYYSDTIVFGNDTLSSTSTSDRDMFLASFDLNANPFNSISLGGTDGNDIAGGAIVLNSGEVVMGGYFQSTTINVGDSTYTNFSPGLRDGVIAKYYAPLSTAFTKISKPTCNSQSDGELIITPKFGAAPYNYTWSHSGGLNDSTATGLDAGTYFVTVTDAQDSTDVAQYTLTEPDAFIFNPNITQVTTCNYSTEGAIDINVTGGNGSNTYQWAESNGGYGTVLTDEDQTGLIIGTYSVTVTDSEGCTGDTTMNITGPDPVTFSGSVVTHYTGPADNGAIGILLTGGTGVPTAYGAVWSGPAGYTQTGQDISGAAAGTFDVTVIDANTCSFDTTFIIQNQAAFSTYIANQKDACKGGSNGEATVGFFSPDGHTNITYLWDASAGSQTTAMATSLAPATYSVTVTDNEALPVIDSVQSVTIGELSYDFTGSLTGTTTVDCKGDADGYIDLSITSEGILPYSYSWSTTAITQDISGLSAGTYHVTATDDNGCTFSLTNFSITEPAFDLTVPSPDIVSDILCNGDLNGELEANPAGGNGSYSYQWNDPANQTTKRATGLEAGFYTVTVTDFKGCSSSSSVNLTEPDALSVSGAITNVDCFGDSDGIIILTVGGGTPTYNYSWTTTDGSGLAPIDKNQSGLNGGTYYLTITDGNLCEISDAYTVTEPSVINIAETSVIDLICNGGANGSIDITVSGGTVATVYTYSWSTSDGSGLVVDSEDQTGLGAGTYDLTVTDDNLCTATTSITLSEPTAINIAETSVNDITCNGLTDGSIDITVSGGTVATVYTYSWSTSDGSGLVVDSEDQAGLGAGTYDLTVTDDNSCTATTSIILTEPTSINIAETSVNDITCNVLTDGSIDITVSGGTVATVYTYSWSTSDGSGLVVDSEDQTGLGAGTYDLTVTDDNSCTATTSIILTEPTSINIAETSVNDITCNGLTDGSIDIIVSGGTPPYTYNWSTSDGSGLVATSEDQTGLGAGTYDLTVTDANLCTATTSITLTEPTVINIAETSVNDITCNGLTDGSIDITVSGGTVATVYTYSWSTSDGSGLVVDSEDQTTLGAGTYDLTVTDDNSCTANTSISIIEPTAISIDSENFTDATTQTTADGSVTVTASGGTGVLEYTLTPGTVINSTGAYSNLTPGDYVVNVTDDNACGPVASNTITVGYPNAIEDISKSDRIKIYPNPTSNKIFIEIDYEGDNLKIEIVSISGQVLLNKEIESHGITKEELDLSTYSKGVYFIRIYNNTFNFKDKILLQ